MEKGHFSSDVDFTSAVKAIQEWTTPTVAG